MSFELEAVRKLVPKQQRSMITQEFLDKIENSVKNPIIADQFKENFITYLNVLTTGKYKMDDYINAVKFVSFKLLNYSNLDAYVATFPERYQRLKDEGQEQIESFASMYTKNKLVMRIYEQTIVPTHVLNAPLHQEALSTLAGMIKDPSVRGLTKVKACEAILHYTKAPEVIENKFTFGVEQQETISDLRAITEELASTYKLALESGKTSLKEVANSKIIDAEFEEVN